MQVQPHGEQARRVERPRLQLTDEADRARVLALAREWRDQLARDSDTELNDED